MTLLDILKLIDGSNEFFPLEEVFLWSLLYWLYIIAVKMVE